MSADKKRIGARLREKRTERHMTVEALAEAFRDAASERDRQYMPKLEDVRRQIRGYESGEHVPRGRNRMLYCAVFEMSEAELFAGNSAEASPWRVTGAELNGSFTPDDEERLVLAARQPSRVDPKVVDSLEVILAEQRRLEDAIGSVPVLRVVTAQLQALDDLVAEARGAVRPRVVEVASQWAQFSGWLHIAVGNAPAARMALDRAAEHAEEIGDTDMIGTVLSWKGHLAERRGEVGPMIGLSAAARRNRHGPGHAYDIFQEARGHALAGDPGQAARLLGEAQQAAADANAVDAREWEYYYLEPGFFDLEVGLTLVHLGRIDPRRNAQAIDVINAGLEALPDGMRRAEWAGGYISHKATAHIQAGDAEAAVSALMEGAVIARSTSSEALMQKLRAIQNRMSAKWPDDPAVAEMPDALR